MRALFARSMTSHKLQFVTDVPAGRIQKSTTNRSLSYFKGGIYESKYADSYGQSDWKAV
jgi:hypothetical protein